MPSLRTNKQKKRSPKLRARNLKLNKSKSRKHTVKKSRKGATKKKTPLKVVELFAGVGGFRVGLEKVLMGKAFKVVWSNQYEPGSSKQWASWVYDYHWGKDKESKHSNKLVEEAIEAGDVPNKFDVLVGGFPCQDYSVAKPNNQSRGIEGKKGVLWWSIYQIAEKHKPKYLILENVDRLTKSPAKQRGRDFAIMLRCLQMLGYHVEWRVINAAEYGMPQRRRRVFIVGYHKDSELGRLMAKKSPSAILRHDGVLARALPCQDEKRGVAEDDEISTQISKGKKVKGTTLQQELFSEKENSLHNISITELPHQLTDSFNYGNAVHTPFMSAGFSKALSDKADVYTYQVYSSHSGKSIQLGDLLIADKDVPKEFHIDAKSLDSWVYQKGGKSETRANYLTTFKSVTDLFASKGIKAELSRQQKMAWNKALSVYWEKHSDGGPGLELTEVNSENKIHLDHAVIESTRFGYEFKEGPLPMPDPLERPMRTIITSEGGSSPSRFKHVVCRDCAKNWAKKRKPLNHDCVKSGSLRRLTPVELEKGNMFMPNHTRYAQVDGKKIEVDARMRAFFMGNALVCGVVQRIGEQLFDVV